MSNTQKHPYRRGACPGAGSAMQTGDGLLSRVRLPGGRLSASQLRTIATLVERWGAPTLELTSRGNLQIRGLSEEGDARLTAALIESQLAVAPSAAEAVRNVLCTCAADLDGSALADPWPLAKSLEELLINDRAYWALPSKFRFLLDGGGATTLAQQKADIRADAIKLDGRLVYRLALAGTAERARPLGVVPSEQTVPAMLALAKTFLRVSAQNPEAGQSLHELLAATGTLPFQQAIPGLQPAPNHLRSPTLPILGAQPGWFGAALPFGQLSVKAAFALAALAEEVGSGELRLTPWRQVLLPHAGPEVAAALEALGLITRYGDPRLSITACTGAPACLSGSTPTRADAEAWATALPQLFDGELVIHVSGCGKGCARPERSPITLAATNGRYDLIINDRATPMDARSCLLGGLEPEAVLPVLRRFASTLNQLRQEGESMTQVVERLGRQEQGWWRDQLQP